MTVKKIFLGLIFGLLIFVGVKMNLFQKQPEHVLTLAMPGSWGPLTPPEQSTHYAEIVLGNIFETLVESDTRGNIIPCVARSWEVSPDLKSISFFLDTTRRFSNGAKLTATAYKQALEQSLLIAPASANSSSLDVLYKIDGYDEFAETHVLKGLVALSEDQLAFHFKVPFRQALYELTGIRFAIYVRDEQGKYLGTGPYTIASQSEDVVHLEKNPFWREKLDFEKAEIHALGNDLLNSFSKAEYDAYFFASFLPDRDRLSSNLAHEFAYNTGAYFMHVNADLNGLPGRLFENPKHRRALLYLFYHNVLPILPEIYGSDFFKPDIQFFQELQYGRLSQDESESIIDSGKDFVEDLIVESKKTPIRICGHNPKLLKAVFEKLDGLGLAVKKEDIDFKESLNRYYKTFDFDIRLGGSGTGGIDPDDFYHQLGQNGAITSPAIGRKAVWDYFEKGRSLLDPKQIHENYQKANQAVLNDVPTIHLGFVRSTFAYDKKFVDLNAVVSNHERLGLDDFKNP